MPKVEITDDLRQEVLAYRDVLKKQVAACQSAGQPLAAFAHLSDARPILEKIAAHWRKSFPPILGQQLAPFVVEPTVFRDLCKYCGAAKASEFLRTLQPQKGDPRQEIEKLLAIFDRVLKGRIYLLENLKCENEATL